jgi:hypothetical protein
MTDTGITVSHSAFCYAKKTASTTKADWKRIPVENTLSDENAFLRWWNLGERQGFVDRLLIELKKL